MKRALVTGANGFVGSHLIPYLRSRGYEIWATSHRHSRQFPYRTHWVSSDLTNRRETLELIRRTRPQYVFHLAAQTSLNESWRDPEKTFALNVLAPISILEGMVRYAPKTRAVFLSSAQVYGATFFEKFRVSEKDVVNPISPYAGSKLLMELACRDYVRREGLQVVIARPFNQIGAGQSAQAVFSQFCRQIVRMEKEAKSPLLEVGNIDVVRDFIHVGDAVRAYELLARKGEAGCAYNVGSEKEISLRKVILFLAKESRVPFQIKIKPELFRKNDIDRAALDCSRLRRLGWRVRESIWEGLREVLSYWRAAHEVN